MFLNNVGEEEDDDEDSQMENIDDTTFEEVKPTEKLNYEDFLNNADLAFASHDRKPETIPSKPTIINCLSNNKYNSLGSNLKSTVRTGS